MSDLAKPRRRLNVGASFAAGLLSAPLSAGIGTALSAVYDLSKGFQGPSIEAVSLIAGGIGIWMIATIFIAIANMVAGVPLHLLLQRLLGGHERLQSLILLLAGAGLGAWLWPGLNAPFLEPDLEQLTWGALWGASAALAATWLYHRLIREKRLG